MPNINPKAPSGLTPKYLPQPSARASMRKTQGAPSVVSTVVQSLASASNTSRAFAAQPRAVTSQRPGRTAAMPPSPIPGKRWDVYAAPLLAWERADKSVCLDRVKTVQSTTALTASPYWQVLGGLPLCVCDNLGRLLCRATPKGDGSAAMIMLPTDAVIRMTGPQPNGYSECTGMTLADRSTFDPFCYAALQAACQVSLLAEKQPSPLLECLFDNHVATAKHEKKLFDSMSEWRFANQGYLQDSAAKIASGISNAT